ncbi:ABC transporter substrate-binding protein [Corynebacterium glyciniphilum]|uniref:ABC transporter substrate-binding protein n=1 Tax=Corynebacterium glyciniphilum TaxID=1404244 RepID=UPI0021B2B07C|nr:ABC transporter substrate-binding protein [Corynebacterium glyciniphilum]
MTTFPTQSRRRRGTAAAAIFLAATVLTACSDNDDSGSEASETTTSGPVTVTHSMGTTEVPRNPEKVVSFSPAWTDAFSALGSPVDIEYRIDGYDDDKPWATNDSGRVETYSADATGRSDNSEDIAAEDPDVIFVSYVPDQAAYDKLNAIAPTVAVVGDNTQSDDWREVTELAGEILDRSGDAADLIQAVGDKIAETKDAHPGLDGASAAFGQISEQGLAVVTDDNDPANTFLSDLGMSVPEEIRSASQDGSRAFIAEENIDMLNTDFLAMWAIGVNPSDLKGWDQLTAVRSGAAYLPDQTSAMALSQPTVASVPWTVDELNENFTAVDDARS